MTRRVAAQPDVRAGSSLRRTASRRADAERTVSGSPAGCPLFLRADLDDAVSALDSTTPVASLSPRVQRVCTACGPDEPCPDCAGGPGVQAQLTVSVPGDPAEVEAERVADHVMHRASPVGAIAGGEGGGMVLSASAGAAGGPAAPFQVPPRSTGRPLHDDTRRFFESRFQRGFGAVRIHDDRAAADSARQIRARAYTHGDQIVFAQGQYAPDRAGGQRLLAHELTHVVQQRADAPLDEREIGDHQHRAPAGRPQMQGDSQRPREMAGRNDGAVTARAVVDAMRTDG